MNPATDPLSINLEELVMKIITLLFLLFAVSLPMVACDVGDSNAEKFGEKVDETLDDSKDGIKDAVDDAGDAIEDACEKATDKNC
jgi:hypothetical protein